MKIIAACLIASLFPVAFILLSALLISNDPIAACQNKGFSYETCFTQINGN
jgi:hypothetical protein